MKNKYIYYYCFGLQPPQNRARYAHGKNLCVFVGESCYIRALKSRDS